WITQHFRGDGGLPKPSQNPTPNRGPDNRHQTECREIHSHDSSGNGDQMSDDWEQTREEDPAGGITVHPQLGTNELRFVDKKETSPFDDDNSSKPQRDPVRNGSAKPRSECPGRDHSPEV